MIGPRKVDKPLVLYGYGRLGHLAEEIFKELGINVCNIISRDIPWVTQDRRDKAHSYRAKTLLAICVATEPYNQVIAPLIAAGWEDIVPVWDIIEAYPEVGLHNGWMTPWEKTSYREEDECDTVMSKFCDKLSKIHYERNHLGWRRIHYEQPIEITPIPSLSSTLAGIRERQKPYRIISGNCDEIEIHNEGHELQTLEWSIGELKRYRPKLSVACYHSRDGLYKIEKFLMENLENYTWKFRLHAHMGQGGYIYGTPLEKEKL